jgi:prepilin-type processing-associated H-X9-DG protein
MVVGTAADSWASSVIGTTFFSGSYGMNGWFYIGSPWDVEPDNYFSTGTQPTCQYPSQTPYFADCIFVDVWPHNNDFPTGDLYNGAFRGATDDAPMMRCTLARHGSRDPNQAPRNAPVNAPFPGNINVGFADGHAQAVKLDNLWQLYWNATWQPSQRPGL